MRTATHPGPGMAAKKSRPDRGYRWGVASRAFSALLGGYFVAWGSTAFLILVLPMSRVDRVVTASLLCFAVWCAAAIYAFVARSAWRAWWVLLAVGGALNAVAYLFAGHAARI
ncbi:DUF3649 domain-containing protein [Pseudoxanthomonas wuyuanensis]